MEILQSLIAIRLLIILGVVNLVTGLLIFFSCRCLPGSRWGSRMMRYAAYRRFFSYHCYIWRVFWPSVMVHALLAVLALGWPA